MVALSQRGIGLDPGAGQGDLKVGVQEESILSVLGSCRETGFSPQNWESFGGVSQ